MKQGVSVKCKIFLVRPGLSGMFTCPAHRSKQIAMVRRTVKCKYLKNYIKLKFMASSYQSVLFASKSCGMRHWSQMRLSFILKSVTQICCKRIEIILSSNYQLQSGSGLTHQVQFKERVPNVVRIYIVNKVAQTKKPHTIIEKLVLPCAKEMMRLVIGEDAA